MYASPYGAPAYGAQPMQAYGAQPMHTQPVTYAAPAPQQYAAPQAMTYAAPAPVRQMAAPVTYAAAPVAQQQYIQQQPQVIQQQPQYIQQQPQVIQQPQVQYVQQQPQVIHQQPQVQYIQQQPQVIHQQPQVQYVQQQQPQMMMQQPQMMMQQPQMMMQQPQMMVQQPVGPVVEAVKNNKVADDKPPAPQQGRVFMLATGIDYRCDKVSWAGKAPLDTQYAHQMLVDLGQRSGAQVFTLWNEQMTRQNLASHIMQIGAMCGPEDTFIFYYTGHGDQLPNDGGGGADGEEMDQCLCLVGPDGATDGPQPDVAVRNQVWMRDDEFAKTVLAAVSPQAKILILLDCCHSETMCDMTEKSEWAKRKQRAISICGCKDKQTSAGTGHGGQFSRALCETIMEMRAPRYNVSGVFNAVLDNYLEHKQAGHTQNISIHGCVIRPNEFAWPLIPQGHYVANLQ